MRVYIDLPRPSMGWDQRGSDMRLARPLAHAILDLACEAEIDATAANGREALPHEKQVAPRKKETKWLISHFMEV